MGVITTASENLDDARTHISNARRCLSTVVNPDTYGYDDYSVDFIKRARKALEKLIKLEEKL